MRMLVHAALGADVALTTLGSKPPEENPQIEFTNLRRVVIPKGS